MHSFSKSMTAFHSNGKPRMIILLFVEGNSNILVVVLVPVFINRTILVLSSILNYYLYFTLHTLCGVGLILTLEGRGQLLEKRQAFYNNTKNLRRSTNNISCLTLLFGIWYSTINHSFLNLWEGTHD
jgi:hypothetical protein